MTDVAERSRRARAALEAADAAIVAALDARARALRQLAELRALDPEGWSGPPRDADVIAAAESAAREMPRELVRGVFREVLGASRRLIAPLRVLYVGPEGGLGHAAAIRHFGRAAELVAVESVTALLDGVRRADEVQGLLPIETSTEGTVAATLEGLLAADLSIVGEITLAASWDLVSATGNASDVDKVYGTASAIAACERQVRAAFPRVTLLDVPTGALAAAMARDDHGAAALVPSVLSGEVDLRTVRASVEDVAGASIRYVVVGRQGPARTGADRTWIAFAVQDSPGAFYRALRPFADRDVNLTRVESRPSRGTAWRYVFFVELDGHASDRPVLGALDELRGVTRFVKVLGSYPRP